MIASSEPVFTTAPARRGCITRAASRSTKNEPARFTSTSRRKTSSVVSASGLTIEMPALLATASMGPSSASTRWKALRTAAESATSAPTVITVPPCARTRCAADSRSSSGRDSSATSAPCRASASALASPIPEAAPVTSAMRPVISPMPASQPVDLVDEPRLECPGRRIAEIPRRRGQVVGALAVPVRQQTRPDLVAAPGDVLLEQPCGLIDSDLPAAGDVNELERVVPARLQNESLAAQSGLDHVAEQAGHPQAGPVHLGGAQRD